MTILSIDVIMVSRYTSPVSLSFTTRLEEMLDMPGFDTIPRAITLTGMFWFTSTSSRVLKQAATPVKLQGSVGGLTNANALASGGDLCGDEALGVLGGGLNGVVLVVQRTLLFTLLLSCFRRSLQEGSYVGLELWWFPQVWVCTFRSHSSRGHIGRSASCRLATGAGLTLPFPAPVFRSTTVPSLLPWAGTGFLPIQLFDLFFQSCCGRQGFPMCFTHSG